MLNFFQGKSTTFLLIVAIVVVVLSGLFGYALGYRAGTAPQQFAPGYPEANDPELDEGVYCTLDALICPDGSAVGRVGPDCEFAECPVE